MEIENLLSFERIEAQELIGHLDILERAYSDNAFNAHLETFSVQCPLILESLKRDTFYRFVELNARTGCISDKHKSLYSLLKERVKCDPKINLERISLLEAVNYKLQFPCLMAQEEGRYGANFSNEPMLYIFNTRDVLYNLVLEGYLLPKNVQNGLGIRQKAEASPRKKYFTRDLMVQSLAHVLFSLDNKNLRWDQTKLVNHNLIKNFSLNLKLREEGEKRPLKDAIQKIIPEEVRRPGNSALKQFTDEELKLLPLSIPNVIFKGDNDNISIDFSALRTVLRTVFLLKKGITPKGTQFSTLDILNFPVLQQFIQILNTSERLVCDYELIRYAKKFGHLDYFAN